MADVNSLEREAIELFRAFLRRSLEVGELSNFYNRIHVLLYNRETLLREWVEVSTIVRDFSDSTTNREEQNSRRDISAALARHIHNFVREHANSNFNINGRITQSDQWGLGLTLYDTNNTFQAFIPLERANIPEDLENDSSCSSIASEELENLIDAAHLEMENQRANRENAINDVIMNEQLIAGENKENEEVAAENGGQEADNIARDDNDQLSEHSSLLDDWIDSRSILSNETVYSNSIIINRPPERIEVFVEKIYEHGSAFFRLIRTKEIYVQSLVDGITSTVPEKPCSRRYNWLRKSWLKIRGALARSTPAFPAMRTNGVRLASIVEFNGHYNSKITSESFAYGEHDTVICYFCAGTITNWLQGDDPWAYHAHFFPECLYVNLKRGKNFVDLQCLKAVNYGPYKSAPPVSTDTSRYECKICMTAEASVVFKPCEHMVTCYDCAIKFDVCPWCKCPIFDAIRCIIAS